MDEADFAKSGHISWVPKNPIDLLPNLRQREVGA
jgi:hypothetical protein